MTPTFITGNANKFAEAKAILGDVLHADIDLPEIQELDPHLIIRHKLTEAQKQGLTHCFVEDTSLYIDAMQGLPGPFIKWFLKALGPAGVAALASSFSSPAAKAQTLIGYLAPDGEIAFFEGTVVGTIVNPRGTSFGWDPIFQPNGYTQTFGEMPKEIKNSISMRKQALEKLRAHLG